MSGGKSTNRGLDYQLWYTAYELSQAFFEGGNIEIKPEAKLRSLPATDPESPLTESELISVDDLYIKRNGEEHFYNIKIDVPPNYSSWTVAALINAKVISQFKEQYEKTPDGWFHFISQSPAGNLIRVLNKIKEAGNEKEVILSLETKDNKYLNEYNKLKEELGYDWVKLKDISSRTTISIYHLSDIEKLIKNAFIHHVTNANLASLCLRNLATVLAKEDFGKATKLKIKKEFKKNDIHLKSLIRPEIIDQLRIESTVLVNQRNRFGDITGTEIVRDEEEKIIKFISTKPKTKEDTILILSGDPGYGKTTILRNVIEKLIARDVPVLGLKADTFGQVTDFSDLEKKLRLDSSIESVLSGLSENHDIVVVLIDQLDALSQYLASDRIPLLVFKRLINSIRDNTPDNVKVVISCRVYDLMTDPELRDLKDNRNIRVGPLQEKDVEYVLKKKEIDYSLLPKQLKSLLKIPLHLDLFCSIYNNDLSLESFNGLEDLYAELWKQKIQYPISSRDLDSDKLEEQLFNISDQMYQRQRISIASKFILPSKELDYLISQGLLVKKEKQLSFFHQSFYDYCYSLKFFKDPTNVLSEEVLANHQGVFARTSTKMVLRFLRNRNPKKYLEELKVILSSGDCRFHLKVMLIQSLGSEVNPSLAEKMLAKELILSNEIYKELFIETVSSLKWFEFLISEGVCDELVKAGQTNEKENVLIQSFLMRMINDFPKVALSYLNSMPNVKENAYLIIRMLAFLEDWSYPEAILLFEKFEWAYNDKDVKHGLERAQLGSVPVRRAILG